MTPHEIFTVIKAAMFAYQLFCNCFDPKVLFPRGAAGKRIHKTRVKWKSELDFELHHSQSNEAQSKKEVDEDEGR